ncbi:Os01g0929901 [Oryza sativa Japonica Group]|jgi:hypothetical protein|uniref:Os01g0929901 protein n=1 Tax=Oryza sativa subsp. japonica TaxID=39947 RepID=A0A0P0VCE5_ORYSJ|nr:hypothetical protein DAI22_01g458001 [Oryza sativa Japonica Group]BAS76026.1 Os01g0929901 [Oryza sativa Japonica Group]
MAAGKVGIAAALLVIAATMLPAAASGDRVVAAPASTGGAGGGEADQCVSRCVGEMQACEAEAASRCAATLSRRGGPCGGCENEYLGCIDIC